MKQHDEIDNCLLTLLQLPTTPTPFPRETLLLVHSFDRIFLRYLV